MHASLSEIAVILLVALLVIKPENLPDAAFFLGRWVKKLRHLSTSLKQQMEISLESVQQDKKNNSQELSVSSEQVPK